MNPQYVAQVGGLSSCSMKRGQFLVQQGVAGKIRINSTHWEPIPVDSFALVVIRDTTVILNHHNIGNHFDSHLISELQKLNINDRVLIFSIYAHDYTKTKIYLAPLEFRIE
jgi:hypothetical protein